MSASDKKKLRKEQDAALTEKQRTQQKEDKQLKTYTAIFAVVMALVVLIAALSMGINWYKNSGTAARNTVALTIGDSKLSNAELNYFFIDTVSSFYNEMYEYYSSYTNLYVQYLYGLDMSTALNLQVYNEETGETWADYFLDSAIDSAKATYTLYNLAMATEGFELSADYQAEVAAALSNARTNASYRGYSNLEDYLKSYYGAGATEESFTNYYTVNAIADAYYAEYAESLTYEQSEIDAYNEEHYDNFSTFNYSYYYVDVESYLPEKESAEDATDETINFTDAEKEAARAAAEADANALATSTSAEALEEAAAQLLCHGDSDKVETVENSTISSIATLYSQWIADRSRQVGDTTVVAYEATTTNDDGTKTTTVNGYYVILFEGREDYLENMINVRHILVAFEGGEKVENEDGTTTTVYSDEEKQAAYDKAKALYDQWLAGDATEESFAAMATSENSDDTGSNTNGGLYENVYNGYMVETFNDWCFAEGRQPGDTGIVETDFGYHIMYFSGHVDQSYRDFCVEYTLRSTDTTEWYNGELAKVTVVEGNTDYVSKGLIITPTSST